ncbi:UshA 5'-nucleotidase/2',3'-cyclic phosphodiesterase and related esterases [Burkholderiaceae bacterium]
MKKSLICSFLAVSGALAVLAGCATGPTRYAAITLNVAHINDHHSQLEPQANATLNLGSEPTRVSLGGFARVTAAMRDIEKSTPNLLKLHAGDAITGTLYYTFFKGQADARLMNTVCFDAFALGNHEFDDGDGALKSFLGELGKGDCKTPVLSANVKPAAGTPIAGVVQPYTVKTVGGVKVGIVGLTIADKTTNSSRPLNSTQFTDEVKAAQATIDTLRRQGIRHIVLLTHQGYDRDVAMAAKLTDLDVIIGGDSHSLLGDFGSLGLKSSGAYPTVVKNLNGETVCVGQAWEYAKAIGLMNVQFDEQGRVAQCGGRAQLLVGDDYARKAADGKWVAMPAAERDALTNTLKSQGAVRVTTPDAQAAQLLAGYSAQVNEQKQRSVGAVAEALCLVRVPGEATNRSASVAGCERANTLARGSDAAQAVAEAFLVAAKRADLSLQNAGGVRIAIPTGGVNMNTAISMLPFTNVLVELSMTGAEIHAALEDAASNHLDNKSSDGSHPYAAGLRWNLDMSKAKGQRFSGLQVKNRSSGAWEALNPQRSYVVVTNDFIADGKDGYTTLGVVNKSGRMLNTYLLYTQSFVDYLSTRNPLKRPARADYSHQNVINAKGEQLID